MADVRVWSVAKFEFARFFDLRGEIISVFILIGLAALRFGGEAMLKSSNAPVSIVTAVGTSELGAMTDSGRLRFRAIAPSEVSRAKDDVLNGKIDGIIVPAAEPGSYQLEVLKTPEWLPDVQSALQDQQRRVRIRELGLTSARYAAVDAPVNVNVEYVNPAMQPKAKSVHGFAIGFMVLSMLGVVGCLAIIMQGIAGEKFGRVSEMVLTAMPAAIWIDGKLIAATLHGLKTIVTYAIYTSAAAAILGFVDVEILLELASNAGFLAFVIMICAFGLLFWNCLFAVVAAMLPSAQSAIRNTLVILPISLMLLCISGAKSPDNGFMIFLSLFPPSAMAAMPVRLLSGQVETVQLVTSIAGLLLSIWALRFLASRIFVFASLSVGTNPGLADYMNFVLRVRDPVPAAAVSSSVG